MSKLLKKGSKGDDVSGLQKQLVQLGYAIQVDGDFGPATEKAVTSLQTAFGYDVDGLVGPGTMGLITAQVGYGWNALAPDATEKALRAQGKAPTAEKAAPVSEKGAPDKGK